MTSHEQTPSAERMVLPSPRDRALGLPRLAAGVAMGLCPTHACPRCCGDLIFVCSQHPGKHTQSQATELAPSAAWSKLGVCCAGGPAAKHSGSSLWDARRWEGEGGSALGSGCCREHPLVGAGHRDLLVTGLYLLITNGDLGSHL